MKYTLNLVKAVAENPLVVSRRRMLIGGTLTGLAGAVGFSALKPRSAHAGKAAMNDIGVLNGALYYEHQAIWAYGVAADQLSQTEIGQAVKAIALANLADHEVHRDTLAQVIHDLGGRPVMAEPEYDLSGYLERGEGGLDSDVNIAKLALALETDAAIAYAMEVAQLQTPALITAGASIASTEASHATTIRAAFAALGMDIATVPAPFVSADTRDQWVIKV